MILSEQTPSWTIAVLARYTNLYQKSAKELSWIILPLFLYTKTYQLSNRTRGRGLVRLPGTGIFGKSRRIYPSIWMQILLQNLFSTKTIGKGGVSSTSCSETVKSVNMDSHGNNYISRTSYKRCYRALSLFFVIMQSEFGRIWTWN